MLNVGPNPVKYLFVRENTLPKNQNKTNRGKKQVTKSKNRVGL